MTIITDVKNVSVKLKLAPLDVFTPIFFVHQPATEPEYFELMVFYLGVDTVFLCDFLNAEGIQNHFSSTAQSAQSNSQYPVQNPQISQHSWIMQVTEVEINALG